MRRHAARRASGFAPPSGPRSAVRPAANSPWSLSRVPAHPGAGRIQAKLKVGAANDPAEAEADRIADRVMLTPAPIAAPDERTGPGLRRKCASCEDKTARRDARSPSAAFAAPPAAEAAVSGLGAGSALPQTERDFFEPRLGADLSGVRIHTGPSADLASRALGARAFTLAGDVAFAKGEYRPGTAEGRRLLAHELTHVLQQGAGTGGGGVAHRAPAGHGNGDRRPGDPLPYRESTELLDCIRIMGPNSEPYCHQTVLGETIPDVNYGTMAVNMTPVVGGADGTVVFTPRVGACPSCRAIRLIQIVRVTATGGADYVFPGAEANRNRVKTVADPLQGIAPNYFVDHFAASCTAGLPCSVYYRDLPPTRRDRRTAAATARRPRTPRCGTAPGAPAAIRSSSRPARAAPTMAPISAASTGASPSTPPERRPWRQAPSTGIPPRPSGRRRAGSTNSTRTRDMADPDIARLVETIDDEPDPLHSESTPSTEALIALGTRGLADLLPLLSSPSQLTRRRAIHVLESVTMARFGFRRGQGWDDPGGEERWRSFWSGMGALSLEGSPAGEETLAKWRGWLDRTPS